MTDKVQLIKEEIERLKDCQSPIVICDTLLQFIDFLSEEPANEDLEEAAKHYLYGAVLYDDVYVGNPTEDDCIRCFKAGAEWQKQQMMKDAVDAIFIQDYAYKTPILYGNLKDKMNIVSGRTIKLCQIKRNSEQDCRTKSIGSISR